MKRRLLLVEDDEVFLRPLHRTLELKGYEVVPVPSARGGARRPQGRGRRPGAHRPPPARDGRRRAGAADQGRASGPGGGRHDRLRHHRVGGRGDAARGGGLPGEAVRGGRAAARDPAGHRVPGAEVGQPPDASGATRSASRFGNIVAASAGMQAVFDLLRSVVDLDTTVLIHGETGVGKELLARSIHFSGARRDRPFVAVNCAAIPAELFESELFGSRRGAFTGATEHRRGHFQMAHGGTLLLDEIGEMPLVLQTQAPARPRGEEGDVGGRGPLGGRGRALHRHHQQGPAGGGGARDLPPRPVLPSLGDAGAGARAA